MPTRPHPARPPINKVDSARAAIMMMTKRLPPTSLAAVAVAVTTTAVLVAQPPARPQPINLQDKVPFDTAIRTATLPNGLQYFIRQNTKPAQRVSMRLAVKAGSMMEEPDQLGLAHLI